MKKVLVSIMMLCVALCTMDAQKANVNKAKTKAFNTEEPDPKGAKELIDAAMQNPETMNDLKSIFAAGQIYNKIQQDETDKQITLGSTCDATLREECMLKVLPLLHKADSMDRLPNEKGQVKPKFTKKIRNELKSLYEGHSIEVTASEAFNRKDFVTAAQAFDVYVDIPKEEVMKDLNLMVVDTNYNFYKYNAGIAHYQVGTKESIAKATQYFAELTKSNYDDQNSVYQILLSLYINSANDTVNYVKTLEEAVEKFPKEAYYIEQLINYFVTNKENEKAVKYLEKAIENEPTFDQYYFLLGRVKEDMGMTDEAMKLYDKTIEMNPTHVYAYIAKGNVIYNRAVDIDTKANELKDWKAADAERAKANKVLEESLVYYEKALELKPDDYENIRWMKSIYYRVGNTAKYSEMEKRLKELGF